MLVPTGTVLVLLCFEGGYCTVQYSMLPTCLADRVVMRFEMFLAFAMNRQTGSVQFSSYEGQQPLNVNFPSLPFPSRPFTSLPQASQPSSLSGASDRETLSCAGSATLVHACRTQPAGSLRGGDPQYGIGLSMSCPHVVSMSCSDYAVIEARRSGESHCAFVDRWLCAPPMFVPLFDCICSGAVRLGSTVLYECTNAPGQIALALARARVRAWLPRIARNSEP